MNSFLRTSQTARASVSSLLVGLAMLAATVPSVASAAAEYSYPELVVAWWQWAKASPGPDSPTQDLTGQHCAVGQSGDIWFLAGRPSSVTAKVQRKCTLPAGKVLFFPVITMLAYRPSNNPNFTCAEAKKGVAMNNETASDLFVQVDGEYIPNVERYRAASVKCFNVFARVPMPYGYWDAFPSATDGYWMLLRPLSPGRHTLRFGGRYNNPGYPLGDMVQETEYELWVQ